ncbi:MAG: TraR/DksA C4-type zinc finger protein, partial [Gammaproteobacteria bacterium AqS3]|nr:TraR/DksA C4-type zinc finger protein [Gammaproteobacteria bacterium AqS3]
VVDLRENERISQLQVKISHSLRMLESGDYGICEDCGVQIGIKRMASRPMATKCIDCKNFQEDLEKNAL